MKKELEDAGEHKDVVDGAVDLLQQEKRREFVRKVLRGGEKEKEKRAIEVIDLTRPEPTFSQKGIYADSVREAFGLRGWEVEAGFFEEKFYRFDKKDFEESEFLVGRKKMWEWMVGSIEDLTLRKNIFVLVDKYDVAQLMSSIRDFLH